MPLHREDEIYEERDESEQLERKEVVTQGKTLDEAVQRGIEELGIDKEDADVEVLEVGGSGLMGRIRGKNAKVRVKVKDIRARRLHEVTTEILRLMEIDADVTLEGQEGNFRIGISSEGADGLLIGRRGETLEALQHIVHRIVAGGDGPLFISMDVSGYRERRRHYLESKARELASVALSQRREVFSEPLTAGERRIFHGVLAEFPHVQARAVGDGTHRKISIAPTNAGRGRYRQERSETYREREEEPSRGGGSQRWTPESGREEQRERGIPPAPESAVGREWMRRGAPRNRRPRRNDFLSPSRGFAGSGYKPRYPSEGGDSRDRGPNRNSTPRRASTRTRYDDEGSPPPND
jgi:spoIIIJ-associated protein